MINKELKHLTHLLNDLQNQKSHCCEAKTDFDVVMLSCELVALIRPQIAKKIKLEVKSSLSFIVHLSESTLRQALLNLLLNAAHALADSQTGYICIEFEKNDSDLMIHVLDNGTGFPSSILEQTIPSIRSCRQRGSGLGLAMTQQFITQMGGQIKLSNRKPLGACVTILLPQECIVATQ
jgi:nitrogen fixation/metabolism regulation signal transduction histidine kinase